MMTIVPVQAGGGLLHFDVGCVHVAVLPSSAGQFARFLLYRVDPRSSARVLVGSGTTHDTASCIEQATGAARRAGASQGASQRSPQ